MLYTHVVFYMANIEDLEWFERYVDDEQPDAEVQHRHIVHDEPERQNETGIQKHDEICNEIVP